MNDAERAALLAERRRAFVEKFGRDPLPDEPVFFDPDADMPTPMSQHKMISIVRAAARRSGRDPDLVIAQYFGPEVLEHYRRQQ